MVCVQGEATRPLVRAFESGADDTTAQAAGETIAFGLNVPGGVGHGLAFGDAAQMRADADLDQPLAVLAHRPVLGRGGRVLDLGAASGGWTQVAAERVEDDINGAERRLVGQDGRLRGEIKVTMPDALATHLLMPDLAAFATTYPEIELEVIFSYNDLDLEHREADVAIRIVADRKALPLNLHGLKGPELFSGVYMSRDRLAAWRTSAPDPIRWIVIDDHGIPDWAHAAEVRTSGVPFRTPDAETQIAAVQQGIGMTKLP